MVFIAKISLLLASSALMGYVIAGPGISTDDSGIVLSTPDRSVYPVGDSEWKPQDDGFGTCPAFTHLHAKAEAGGNELDELQQDGLCHYDDTDQPIMPRRTLTPDPAAKWL